MKTYSSKKTLLLLLFFVFINHSFGQSLVLSNDAKVSVITCGTGNESYSLFGHTAIRIEDSINAIDLVYNYGTFDFRTPNFVAKFTKGDLQYYATVHPYIDFINEYDNDKRSVYEQELNIPENLKQKLFDNLNKTLLSEDRYYTYKFIDKNCTSMVVDVINKSLNGTVITKKGDRDKTYRTILYPYFDGHFYEKLGISIIFGKKVDELGTKIFLPFELKNSLAKTTFQNHPLVKETKTILSFDKVPSHSWWNNWYTYIIVLAFIIFINKRSVDKFYLLIMGLLGLFFVFVSFYSLHKELEYNYNILLFSPFLLILLVLNLMKNKKWTYRFSLIHLISLITYALFMINKASFLIVLPLIITSGVVLIRIAIKNKKPIPIII
ncbi:DUF4105 domain-containing protein [Flavobacterium sp. EDS]|uniref:lipoprotein N-acyltransferase Lnb domain-containing protein n=1 Tax=Flavobacterium sp. EDS TaxID=2897328 RepID=UPI001E2834EC|nr:DUF4105 domain-containing protein [Flavobacterium sp. EDS]MCD0473705.1 DUF4105 domain-containing protein [Flavobacterium sp. EDS]